MFNVIFYIEVHGSLCYHFQCIYITYELIFDNAFTYDYEFFSAWV